MATAFTARRLGKQKRIFEIITAISTVVTGAVAAGGILSLGLFLEVTKHFRLFGSVIHINKDFTFLTLNLANGFSKFKAL